MTSQLLEYDYNRHHIAVKYTYTFDLMTLYPNKVEGFVNQTNDNFALAAGLYEIAVYDFSKHQWFVYKKAEQMTTQVC